MGLVSSPPSITQALYRYVPALESLRNYGAAAFRADTLAGLTVATVAVPQAMAYAIAAGLPPEHGLYTAIVMTAVGALLDSSKQLINGPTNVISIAVLSALAPIPAEHKVEGAITLALLVGAFQTLITLLRLGDLTRYISHSVVLGFTAGASLLLVLDQTRNLLGWSSRGAADDHFLVRLWHTWSQGGWPHASTLAVGLGAVALILLLRWAKRRLGMPLFPELFVTVIVLALVVAVLRLDQHGVAVVGAIPSKLPAYATPSFTYAWELSESALAIATLGLLEALAMAKHIAGQTGQKLDPNQQCLSEGLANLTGSLFQCMPGSGSLTRSAINQQAGAVSQWSGLWSALAVGIITVALAPYARYIPRSALAGLLIVSAFSMVDWRALAFHVRATRFDAVIVATTAIAAVAVSVEFCILIGVLFSFVFAIPRAGRVTRTEFIVSRGGVVQERNDLDAENPRMLIFGLEGELFFGSAITLDEHFEWMEGRVNDDTKVVVIRAKRLRNPDAVGLRELDRFVRRMKARGIHVILAGVRQDLLEGLRGTGVLDELGPSQVFTERERRGSSTTEAVQAGLAYLRERFPESERHSAPVPILHYEI
jgi:SulP family sulfate permease